MPNHSLEKKHEERAKTAPQRKICVLCTRENACQKNCNSGLSMLLQKRLPRPVETCSAKKAVLDQSVLCKAKRALFGVCSEFARSSRLSVLCSDVRSLFGACSEWLTATEKCLLRSVLCILECVTVCQNPQKCAKQSRCSARNCKRARTEGSRTTHFARRSFHS